MIILFFILAFGCSKQNSYAKRKCKIKFIPLSLKNIFENNIENNDDDNENFNLEDNNQNIEQINNEGYLTLFEIVESRRTDILVLQLPYIEDLDILEEVNENEETFLHLLIKNIQNENYKEERDLVEIIEILKNKDGFDWNKKSHEGSYAFLAFKNNLFFSLASLLEKDFDIEREDLKLYLDLMIESEDDFSNKCLRLFLGSLHSNQIDTLTALLKNNLLYYENTFKERVILNLIEGLSSKDDEEVNESDIEIDY